jgi:hypothetical protein
VVADPLDPQDLAGLLDALGLPSHDIRLSITGPTVVPDAPEDAGPRALTLPQVQAMLPSPTPPAPPPATAEAPATGIRDLLEAAAPSLMRGDLQHLPQALVESWLTHGPKAVAQGVADLSKTIGQTAVDTGRGVSLAAAAPSLEQILSGAGITALPAGAPSLVASPLAAVRAAALGMGLSAGAHRAATAVGADPRTASLVGSLAANAPPELATAAAAPLLFKSTALRDLLAEVGGKGALKLGALARADPSLRTALASLTPDEAKVVAGFDPSQLEDFGRVSAWLPTNNYFGALARAGSAKIGWYGLSRRAIESVFGEDAGTFAGLLAATSPQNPVETNLMNTLKIYRGWTQAGRPTDEASILRIMGENVQGTKGAGSVLPAWINNTVETLRGGETLSGPKVDSFWKNLSQRPGASDYVTLDAWMSHLLGLQQSNFAGSATDAQLARGNPGYSPGYLATSAKLRQAATAMGLSPEQMQESMWSWGKALMEQAKNTGVSAEQIVKTGTLNPTAVSGTPDFSTLFHDPAYADVIGSLSPAHQQRLTALAPGQFASPRPPAPGDERWQLQAARKLDELLATRKMESALRTGTNPDPRGVMVTTPLEGVPGRDTGIAPELFTPRISEGQRQNFGSAILQPETNPRGQDVVLRAVTRRPSIESTRGTGVYTPPTGPTEFNRLNAAGTRVPVTAAGEINRASPAWKEVEAAVRFKAAFSGQQAAAASGLRYGGPRALDDAMHILTPNVVKGDVLEGLAKLFPDSEFAIVNQGGSTQGKEGAALDIFHTTQGADGQMKTMTDAEMARARDYLTSHGEKTTPKSVTSGRNVAGFFEPLPAYGEGRVTKWALQHYDEMPTVQKGLDTPEVKDLARRKLAAYDREATRLKLTVPDNFRLMLQTVADGGVSALRRLYSTSKELLPVLVLMGLARAGTPREPER